MHIEKLLLNKHNQEIGCLLDDSDETRISFYFDDDDNWHFQLKKSASKVELKNALLGVVRLIEGIDRNDGTEHY